MRHCPAGPLCLLTLKPFNGAPEHLAEREILQEFGWPAAHPDSQGPNGGMKKVEAIIRPSTFELLGNELQELCVGEIVITDVRIRGGHGARRHSYRGVEYDVCLPNVKLEMLILGVNLPEVVEILSRDSQTENAGFEVKILVYDVAELVPHAGH